MTETLDVERGYTVLVSAIPSLYRSWRDSPNETAVRLNRMLLDAAIEWVQSYQRATGREPDDFGEYAATRTPTPPEGLRDDHPVTRVVFTVLCGTCGADVNSEDDNGVPTAQTYRHGTSTDVRALRLAASPAPDPGAGLAELRQAIEDELALVPDDDTEAFDAGAAAAYNFVLSRWPAPSAEPPETA